MYFIKKLVPILFIAIVCVALSGTGNAGFLDKLKDNAEKTLKRMNKNVEQKASESKSISNTNENMSSPSEIDSSIKMDNPPVKDNPSMKNNFSGEVSFSGINWNDDVDTVIKKLKKNYKIKKTKKRGKIYYTEFMTFRLPKKYSLDERLKASLGKLPRWEYILREHGIQSYEIEEKQVPGVVGDRLFFHDETNTLCPSGMIYWSRPDNKMVYIVAEITSNDENFKNIKNMLSKKYGEPIYIEKPENIATTTDKLWKWGNQNNAAILFVDWQNSITVLYVNYENLKKASGSFDNYLKAIESQQHKKEQKLF